MKHRQFIALILLVAALLAPQSAFADPGSAGFSVGLDCPTRGDVGVGSLLATTGGGFSGNGSCERVPGLFTRMTFTTYNASMAATTVYAVHTPSVLITPPFRTGDVQPVFAVASACPIATSTLNLNWLFVQWSDSEQKALTNSYVLGTATYSKDNIVITGQYDVDGSPYFLSPLPMPGSCDPSTGIYAIGSSPYDDVRGNVYFNAAGMGVFKTSAQRATFFFPRYHVTAATDFGSRSFRGLTFDSWAGNGTSDVRNVIGVADAAGDTISVQPLSDPSDGTVDVGGSAYLDTLELDTFNSPADGIITGTVTRTGAGAGSGLIGCIANRTGGEVLLFCSGQSPSDNAIPYHTSLYVENRFGHARSFAGRLRSVAYDAANSRAYVAGDFRGYNGRPQGGLAALTTTGFDTSFDIGRGFDDDVAALAYDSSADKVYAGGYFQNLDGESVGFLVRLNADGTRDTTFGIGLASQVVLTVLPDVANSRVWIGGHFGTYDSTSAEGVAKVNLDGTIDTSFATVGTGFDNAVNRLLWDNGASRLYVAGEFTEYDGVSRRGIARLTGAGALDTPFDPGTGFASPYWVSQMARDSSNRLYVVGRFAEYDGTPVSGIVRLTGTGAVDTAFVTGSGLSGDGYTVKYDPVTDKIYVGGEFQSYDGTTAPNIVRLNLDGTIDSTFTIGTGFDGTVYDLHVEASGDLWAVGTFNTYRGNVSPKVARVASSGSYVAGPSPTQAGFSGQPANVSALDPLSGKVYVGGGTVTYNGEDIGRLVRLNEDGTKDTSFDTGTGFDYYVNALRVTPAGDIYVGGIFQYVNGTYVFALTRLQNDGTLDPTYPTGFLFDEGIGTIELLPADQIVVGGGFTSRSGAPLGRIARMNANGSLDVTFNTGTGFDATVNVIVRDGTTGKLYVGGHFTEFNGVSRPRLARLNSDGTLDTAFSVGTGFDSDVRDIKVDEVNGKVYVVGAFTSYDGNASNGIIRLTGDGSVDSAFVVGTGFNSFVSRLAFEPTYGKVVVAGGFSEYRGVSSRALVRINPDGSLDTTFAIGIGFQGEVVSILLDPLTGLLYAGGWFSAYQFLPADTFLRLAWSGAAN